MQDGVVGGWLRTISRLRLVDRVLKIIHPCAMFSEVPGVESQC